MTHSQEEALRGIQIFTNATTEEINYESIFDAVKITLDNKIEKITFINFFHSETSLLGFKFNESFTEKLYQEYSWLYNYLYANRSKLR